jgi:hypothetical protein
VKAVVANYESGEILKASKAKDVRKDRSIKAGDYLLLNSHIMIKPELIT